MFSKLEDKGSSRGRIQSQDKAQEYGCNSQKQILSSLCSEDEASIEDIFSIKATSPSPITSNERSTSPRDEHLTSCSSPNFLNSNSSDIESFHSFPKLPSAARKIIWKNELPGVRFVTLRFVNDTTNLNIEDRIILSDKPSPLFYVNKESRKIAMKKYYIQLSSSKVDDCRSRIDPENDTVLFHYHYKEGEWYSSALLEQRYWSRAALNNVKSIALDSRMIKMGFVPFGTTTNHKHEKTNDFECRRQTVYENVMKFSGLENLSIIYHHRHCDTSPTQAMLDSEITLREAKHRRVQINRFIHRVMVDMKQIYFGDRSITKWTTLPGIYLTFLRVGDTKCCKIIGDRKDILKAWSDGLEGEDLSWSDDELLRKGKKEYRPPQELREEMKTPRLDWKYTSQSVMED